MYGWSYLVLYVSVVSRTELLVTVGIEDFTLFVGGSSILILYPPLRRGEEQN